MAISRKGKKKPNPNAKPSRKKWYIGIGAVVLTLFWWWAVQPIVYSGTILFGICRTYIELNTQYPTELDFIDLRERGPRVSVEYTTVDAFGQHIAHEAVCTFKRGPNQEVLLDTVRLRRGLSNREYKFALEDPKKIEAFNPTIPVIAAYPPQLYVYGPSEDIQSLKK